MRIQLSKKELKSKPQRYEVGKIKNETLKSVYDIDIYTLADKVGNYGRSFFPAYLQGGSQQENFVYMELFALDFDNKKGDYTFEDIKNIADVYRLPILFAYESLRSTDARQRFRIVFRHKFPIDDVHIAKIMIGMLLKIFPQADRACKDVNRIFFGGKKLLYCNADACVHMIDDLLFPLYNRFDTNNNYCRNLNKFAKDYGILNDGKHLLMTSNSIGIDFDENKHLNIINNISKCQNTSILERSSGDIKIYTMVHAFTLHNYNVGNDRHKNRKSNLNLSCKRSCKLLNDFADGILLGHNERFAILTNLSQICGGYKHFMDILEMYYPEETISKWNEYKYVADYYPQSCSPSFCPYYYDCHAGKYKNIIGVLSHEHTVTYDGSYEYKTINEAERNLYNNFNTAMESPVNGLHMVCAQTGLGKTSCYIEYISKNKEQKFIVAVPTNIIKEEVSQKLIEAGVSVFVTPTARDNYHLPQELRDEIERLHELGLHKEAKKVIQEYRDDEDNAAFIGVLIECDKLLQGIDGYNGEQVIVTTHAFYVHLDSVFVQKFNIIIDEDILYLTMGNSIKCVSMDMIYKLRNSCNSVYASIAGEIISAPDGQYTQMTPVKYSEPLSCDDLEELEIYGNVNDLVMASSFIKDKNNASEQGILYYFAPPILPKAKAVILSATFDTEIYRRYFNSEIIEYPIINAKYKGKIKQYTYHSLGRRNLRDKDEAIKKFIENELSDAESVISFKNFDINTTSLHYGNAMGSNSLEGKDIVIIGTPYKNERCYKLFATAMGIQVTDKDECRKRHVYYKGFGFEIMTYKNEYLRQIQFYSITSELEQCVGRARLLRYDCTVFLLSGFPVEQAELITFDYLERKEPSEIKDELKKAV